MKTVMSVKIDTDVKASAQEVAKSAGLTLSSLVNAYLRQVAATRRIELYAPEPMTPKLEKLIQKVEKEIAAGATVGPFETADDFLKALQCK
ncbi:MAG: type II toxin-antitoxin system RelB/DinJ family antitoxin [Ignavibacteriae bacterium]|nr:type II toxin-antitoxin system RelB/DinJ family antitoxin [Ignavibacteriota bacterium]